MIDRALDLIDSAVARLGRTRSTLVGLSGIHGSGKGHVARLLAKQMGARKLRTVVINIGRWFNPPDVWLAARDPAKRLYRHAVRFDEMFSRLVLPLRDTRFLVVERELPDELATLHPQQRYEFDDVDVIILAGSYLLQREYLHHYDVRIWVDCSFETALERAVARAHADGRSPGDTTNTYETIYFPAQLEHFTTDAPRESADVRIVNDYRMQPIATAPAFLRVLH